MDNAIIMASMQIGSRFIQFNLTDAQKKLIQNPVSQSLLLLFMFYAASRRLVVSVVMVVLYYVVTFILLNEKHPLNIYSRKWLMREGFIDQVEDVKKVYYENIAKL